MKDSGVLGKKDLVDPIGFAVVVSLSNIPESNRTIFTNPQAHALLGGKPGTAANGRTDGDDQRRSAFHGNDVKSIGYAAISQAPK